MGMFTLRFTSVRHLPAACGSFVLYVCFMLVTLALSGCDEVRAEREPAQIAQPAAAERDDQATHLAKHGIELSREVLTDPREIAIVRLKIDLHHPDIRLACLTMPDPDGEGPAETELRTPLFMAERSDTLVAFNANAFSLVTKEQNYQVGAGVRIHGIAIEEGQVISPVRRSNAAFWIDAAGQPHIGRNMEETPADAQFGVAGFQTLIVDGQVQPKDDVNATLAPRTAVGFDEAGRFLHVLIVDGRQPGYSMGMTYLELAHYMVGLGCHNAINLDGGGSTALIVRDPQRGQRIVNQPSTKVLGISLIRPVAVTVGVVKREASGDGDKR